ncbi:MAG: ion transporter [Oscillospiraceae bacterium]|nr:ion transporter [Oscillospiraceae bacterium]
MNNSGKKPVTFKRRIFQIIQPHKRRDTASIIFDWLIISFILLNFLIIVLGSTVNSPQALRIFYVVETVFLAIFTLEYFLRLWTANVIYKQYSPFKAALRHAFTFTMIVDFLAIMPFYLQLVVDIDAGVFIVFRLFRVFMFLNAKGYRRILSEIEQVFKKKSSQLLSAMSLIIILMIISSSLMYVCEKNAQPDVFKNVLSGLWWSVTTLTTIGYGDIHPVTIWGKLLGSVFALLSIAIIAIPTGIISSGFVEIAYKKRKAKEKSEKQHFCPYCGKKIN